MLLVRKWEPPKASRKLGSTHSDQWMESTWWGQLMTIRRTYQMTAFHFVHISLKGHV